MKKGLLLLFFVTVVNGLVFLFREKFAFTKYSTYAELYGACDGDCREKWADFLTPYSQTTLAEGRRLLQPLRLDTGATTWSKISAIGHHLYERFHRQGGYPADIIHRSDAVDAYKILSADTTQKIWCGTYALMFGFFCWTQNITNRVVEIYKPGDHHVANECYLPEEKKWVLVDLTGNILSVFQNGERLNTQDFVSALPTTSKTLAVQEAGSLATKPYRLFDERGSLPSYYGPSYPYFYYHDVHSSAVYHTGEKLKRYVLPVYWYEIFSPRPRGNFLFWLKPVFLALWLLLAGAVLFKLISQTRQTVRSTAARQRRL